MGLQTPENKALSRGIIGKSALILAEITIRKSQAPRALAALTGLKTVNELASTYGVHPTQMAHGKHRLQKEMPEIFSARRAKREHEHEAFQAQLSQQIGQLKVRW